MHTIPLVNETAQYKLFNVSLNNIHIRSQDIIDIQINFNQTIKGKMSFVDTLNSAELMPMTYSLLNITYIDAANQKYDGSFIITEVSSTRLKNNSVNISVKFDDIKFDLLANSYISRAFSNMTMMKMLESVFTELGVSAIFYHGTNEFIYE